MEVSRYRPLVSRAARPRPDDEHVGVVVSVRDASLRESRAGLVLSLCLVAAVAAIQPSWKVFGWLGVFESAGAVYVGVRAAFQFRSQLEEVEPLPTDAIETFGRPERRPLSWKQRLSGVGIFLAAVAVWSPAARTGWG